MSKENVMVTLDREQKAALCAIATLRDRDLSDAVNEAISNYLEMNQKRLAESTKNLEESEVISNYNLAQPYLKNVSHWIRNNCLIFCHND
jgi:predicted transcriptional regulator